MLSFSADEYESKKNRETSGQQRLTALLDAPGGRDDLEEEDEEDTEPTVARADDIDAELTVSEIMDLEPKKMVMNSSEKIMNRYYEGALGPVENVTALQAVAESSVGCLHGWRCAVACPLLACACSFGRWQRSRVQAKSEYTHTNLFSLNHFLNWSISTQYS